MANPIFPAGLKLLSRSAYGGDSYSVYAEKPSSGGTAIFPGDVVSKSGADLAPGGTPGTTVYFGVALNFGKASMKTGHEVIPARAGLWIARANNDATGLVAADEGKRCNFEFGAGVLRGTEDGVSGHVLDPTTKHASNDLDTFIIRKNPSWHYTGVENAYGQYSQWVIEIRKATP